MATMTQTQTTQPKHYLDWPNTAGFNALEDHRTPVELKVTGKIPAYAAGSLYRTGPGGYKIPRQDKNGDIETSHWFDGFSTTHHFEISSDSKVTYSSYRQVDELIENMRKTGRRDEATFGQKRDPCDGLFKKIKTAFTPPTPSTAPHYSNIGVAIRPTMPAELKATNAGSERRIMTLTTDTATVKQFDMDTLEPLGVTSQTVLHPELSGPLSAAHAEHDPVNGDIFNYNLSFGAKPVYRVFRASPTTGKVDILATFSGNDIKGSYLHSMLLTENFVVLCIWNAYYQMGGASILWNRNLLDAIQRFDPKDTATWVVIDRRDGRGVVKKFTTPAFFCFHTVNAWEEAGSDGTVDITCELIQYDNLDVLHWLYYENMVSDGAKTSAWNKANRSKLTGGLTRYKLSGVPLASVDRETSRAEKALFIPFPDAGDLPRFNPNYSFKPHRYVYGIIDRQLSSFIDAIGKTDTKTKTCVLWQTPKHTPGEPIFVPRPGAVDEDDGVVLTVVLNGETGVSYLLCLDARDMKEIGRADVGHPVGLGFHGAFLPSKV